MTKKIAEFPDGFYIVDETTKLRSGPYGSRSFAAEMKRKLENPHKRSTATKKGRRRGQP